MEPHSCAPLLYSVWCIKMPLVIYEENSIACSEFVDFMPNKFRSKLWKDKPPNLGNKFMDLIITIKAKKLIPNFLPKFHMIKSNNFVASSMPISKYAKSMWSKNMELQLNTMKVVEEDEGFIYDSSKHHLILVGHQDPRILILMNHISSLFINV